MSNIYVSAGDIAVTSNADDVIKTLALGSGVAVIFIDAENSSVGLLHVTLPDSTINVKQSLDKPGTFADTGIPRLIDLMKKKGYKSNGTLTVKLVGGASLMEPQSMFNIGKRNISAIKKALWKFKLGSIAEDLGNSINRSATVECASGRVTITSPGRGVWEI